MRPKSAAVIIVAGGSGSRMGRSKQMLPLNGKAILERSVEAVLKIPSAGEVIVVTGADIFRRLAKKFKGLKHALPGATRLQSVQNGVAAADAKYKFIAVHDGARPLVSPAAAQACLEAAAKTKAAVLAVPLKDTVKEVKDNFVSKTLDRARLWAAQTPQCYEAATLRAALKKYGALKDATDESQLVERLGVKVAVVPSGYENIKITTPEDLIIAGALCKKLCRKKN
ncbi:MAG: 2-C-methyl-D-erythritol 4-phosphate cytidylyltransferase [Elusimicrobiota bacterium]|nr:2-C-methyl-D-erythritol 4-phosphate cytidylyltransferase [Elusimicrobiota bacterium]